MNENNIFAWITDEELIALTKWIALLSLLIHHSQPIALMYLMFSQAVLPRLTVQSKTNYQDSRPEFASPLWTCSASYKPSKCLKFNFIDNLSCKFIKLWAEGANTDGNGNVVLTVVLYLYDYGFFNIQPGSGKRKMNQLEAGHL